MPNYMVIIFGLILVSAICSGQVNFTPNWGKRAAVTQVIDTECKTSLESLLYIYKILQSEAQKIIECKKMLEM